MLSPSPRFGHGHRWFRRYAALAAAILVLAIVLAGTGGRAVSMALGAAGPAVLWLTLLHPLLIVPNAVAWQIIFGADDRPRLRPATIATWVGTAINQLTPAAGVGGDLAKARWVAPSVGWTMAAAALVVDKTCQALAVLVLAAIGCAWLMFQTADRGVVAGAGAGTLALAVGIAGFLTVQRTRVTSRLLARLVPGGASGVHAFATAVEDGVVALGARYGAIALAVGLRVGAIVLLSIEVWLAAGLIGHPMTFADALLLRIVAFAARSAAFFVWGGLGVQEGAFAVLAPLVGMEPATLVALSLLTRVREVVAGVPALLLWTREEAARARAAESTTPVDRGNNG